MSYQYDQYLVKHKENVRKGYEWFGTYLPELVLNVPNLEWQVCFAHDQSKSEPDEYEAYDAYFYGNNKSYQVVQDYRKAWLLHIHRNPHHWQHWILINDDPTEGEIVLDMPYNYILEMICDWWAFSWQKGNLGEIFTWYDEHKMYMKLSDTTRKKVEDILDKIRQELFTNALELAHHGIKGQKWGVRNGPPYPIDRNDKHGRIVKEAIESGEVSKKINREKQLRHTRDNHLPGRSYLDGDLEYAQELVDKLSGTGEALIDSNGNWTHKEHVKNSGLIGTYVNPNNGNESKQSEGVIVYSKTGSHIYPAKKEEED